MTTTTRYSLGDRVRVIAEGDELFGQLGTVSFIYEHRVITEGCGVRLDGNNPSMHFEDDELEAVDELTA